MSRMLHLCKVAVGVRDIAHLRQLHAACLCEERLLRHRTRNRPRRAEDITEAGSLFWVIGGLMLVRQRIMDIQPDQWDDSSPCTSLVLNPELVPVVPRPMKPFQGWRYLEAANAPADLPQTAMAAGEADLPAEMLRALRSLCLL